MYSYPVVNKKPIGAILLGEIIKIGGRAYRVVDKYVNLEGDQALTLEDVSHPRFTVKLTIPRHLMVTTHSRTEVHYIFEEER